MPNYSTTSYLLGHQRAISFYNNMVTNTNPTIGYVMVGRQVAWANGDNAQPIYDTEIEKFATYNDFLGGKKITGNDIYPVIPRVNWQANVVWTQYDDASNTQFNSTNSMYVMASGGNVYKCINNANGAYSTIEPANNYTTANGFTSPGDGYTWKYMYKVPTTSKYLTTTWMPVPMTQTESYFGFANNLLEGAVSRAVLTAGGNGYSNTNTYIVITGSGVNANVTANVTNGTITSVTVINKGSGYLRTNTKVRVVGSGANANVRLILSPYKGHAFNPAKELGANTLMISVKVGDVDSTESGRITANNDFRQLALLFSPHKYGENVPVSSVNANVAVSMASQLVLTSGPAYLRDEMVYQGNSAANAYFSANVSDVFTNAIQVNGCIGTPLPGDILTGMTSGVARTLVSNTNPEFDIESGQLVYVENRGAVTRALGQAEWIKITIGF